MEYFTADSYKGWERIGKPFDKNGKLYTRVKSVCNRCNGTGIAISHIENGVPVPYTPDNGVCYSCESKGFFDKEVRLYTEAEYTKMVATNEANRIKREAAKEAEMKAHYQEKKNEWLSKEGFSQAGITYVMTGDTYAIKEELKEKGWRFNTILKWHKADAGEYADRCFSVDIAEVADFSAWGTANYHSDAQKYIQDKLDAANPQIETEWYGNIKDKVELEVEVKSIRGFESRYGYSKVYTFIKDQYVFTWFTATNQSIEVGDIITLTGTVKDHTEYKNTKQTVLTRCKCL